jgi:hypothetical protein
MPHSDDLSDEDLDRLEQARDAFVTATERFSTNHPDTCTEVMVTARTCI